jgi:hypothetical protein
MCVVLVGIGQEAEAQTLSALTKATIELPQISEDVESLAKAGFNGWNICPSRVTACE